MYWKITPSASDDADFRVLPAENAENHDAALQYAQDRLEGAWDRLTPGRKATVTMELVDEEGK